MILNIKSFHHYFNRFYYENLKISSCLFSYKQELLKHGGYSPVLIIRFKTNKKRMKGI